jgi:anti-sigma regulatory factor (Ser/Thr protein kinase)
VLGLDSLVKLEPDGFQRYVQLRQSRLAALAHGTVVVRIAGVARDGRPMLSIVVKDSGPGFDHVSAMAHAAKLDAPYGRGIPLLKRVCEEVEYRGAGNEVEVLFPLDRHDVPAAEPAAE